MSCSWIDAIFVAAAKDAESPKISALSNETALTFTAAPGPLQTQQQRNKSDKPSSEVRMQPPIALAWSQGLTRLDCVYAEDHAADGGY